MCSSSSRVSASAIAFANLGQNFDSVYANGFASYPQYSPFPYPFPTEGYAPPGLIPVELDIEGLYEDHDRRRRKNPTGTEKVVASHVHSVCHILSPPPQ